MQKSNIHYFLRRTSNFKPICLKRNDDFAYIWVITYTGDTIVEIYIYMSLLPFLTNPFL